MMLMNQFKTAINFPFYNEKAPPLAGEGLGER
jgi:hypothetical protein